jgi:hypothetical protein
MVTFISKEWRDACRSVRSVIVGKLCDWKEISPIVLLIITVDTEILLQGLILSAVSAGTTVAHLYDYPMCMYSCIVGKQMEGGTSLDSSSLATTL